MFFHMQGCLAGLNGCDSGNLRAMKMNQCAVTIQNGKGVREAGRGWGWL